MLPIQVRSLYICVCVMLFVGLFQGCKGLKSPPPSTLDKGGVAQEEKEYNFVQNFTSKYNILYNANLMLDNEWAEIFNSAHKNFQIRQSVFDEPLGENVTHPLMDSLIAKSYKIVHRKQESKYVNEAYFIIGKANYLKGDYHTSIEFFNHLLRSADEQKEYLPLAYAWKSRSLLQIGKPDQAKQMLDSAFVTMDANKATRTFINAAMANYFIHEREDQKAIPYLEYALESNSNRLDSRRWMFLLAQLYKDSGESDKALAYFSKISKGNVPYDMAFEAALQSSLLKGARYARVEDQVKPLLRMLREGKNDGYQDQILFQIGEIYLQREQPEQAVAFYKRSLAEPNRSNYQATETYLKLGDYYFGKKQYFVAQLYYDSVATVLPTDYTDVNKIRRRLGHMGEITKLFHDVSQKDTLLSLAALSEQERDSVVRSYADQQLTVKKAQLAKALHADKKKANSVPSYSSQTAAAFNILEQQEMVSGSSDKTFYFNNPDERLLGQTAFKRRWGNRQLKDNWRYEVENAMNLSQVASSSQQPEVSVKEVETLDEDVFISTVMESYRTAIPVVKSEQDSMHKVIHDNLIAIGNIYRDNTYTDREAIAVYEEFLRRYPNTEEGPAIYYSLYSMYAEIDPSKSMFYKDRLIALYPNSLHAKVAKDPAYMDKYRRDKNILDRLFERLFDLYASGDYTAVIAEADRELQGRFDNSALVAQVEYLKALAIGRVGRVEDFTKALFTIVQQFPSDSLVTPLAKENIIFIEQNPAMFVNRVNALQDRDKSRIAFVDEPHMTPSPLLTIEGDYRTSVALVAAVQPVVEKEPTPSISDLPKINEKIAEQVIESNEKEQKVGQLEELEVATHIGLEQQKAAPVKIGANVNNIAAATIDLGASNYRDENLLPDSATYYFIVNVMNAKVNLAPSRYGIGQFNRTRYQRSAINHQLKVVNDENQLVFVGPFQSLEEVKLYEARILPMIEEIMKIPSDIYNTFVITKEFIPSLVNGVTIQDYHQQYIEQY